MAAAGGTTPPPSVSPDGRYRVDPYQADRPQRLLDIASFEEPGFARLSRLPGDASMGASPVPTPMDGRATWLPDVVVVGTQVRHRLPEGGWE